MAPHKGQAKVLSSSELKRLSDVIASNKHSLRNTVIMSCSYLLGLRCSEICSVRLSDVLAPDGKLVQSFKVSGKGDKTRDVFLSNKKIRKHLKEYLDTRKDDHPDQPLIKSQRTAFTPNTLQICMKNLYKKAGIDGARSHSGRRWYATNLIERGFDIKSVSVLMGHQNVQTTALYIQSNPVMLARMVEHL